MTHRPHTAEERAAAARRARERWADPAFRQKMAARRAPQNRTSEWKPPEEFRELYADLRSKFHAHEARRLVEDHMRVVERRRAAAGARA